MEVSMPIKAGQVRFLIGREGANVKKMRESHPGVRITFPEKNAEQKIVLKGKKDEVMAVRKAIEKQIQEIPVVTEAQTIVKKMDLDSRFHPKLIGAQGKNLHKIQQEFKVEIRLPRSDDSAPNVITIKSKDEAAIKDCIAKLRQLEKEFLEEFLERNQFTATLPVEAGQVRFLIGRDGANVKKMRKSYPGVRITFPEKNAEQNIVLKGKKDEVLAVRKAIEKQIQEIPDETDSEAVVKEMELDSRFHPKLIGAQGKNLRKIQQEFKVEIRLPRSDESAQNVITIKSKEEAHITDCIAKLRQMEEEFMEDFLERSRYIATRPKQETTLRSTKVAPSTPWKYQSEDFPEIGSGLQH